MAEVMTLPFVMHGAYSAVAGSLVHDEHQVQALEQAVDKNPGLAFDLAKTLAADTIIGSLHRVHRQDHTPLPSPRAMCKASPVFNDSVDNVHGMIHICEAEFRLSEVLFQMEPETYRVYLTEFDDEARNVDESADAGAGGVR